jgi:hypothetical protein
MASVPNSQPDAAQFSPLPVGTALPPDTRLPGPTSPGWSSPDWTHYVAAGTVIAGGALIATGHRRAGMAVAATGAAMALLEEQEAVKSWWKNVPAFLAEAQVFLDKVDGYLKEATVQGARLQSILRRD